MIRVRFFGAMLAAATSALAQAPAAPPPRDANETFFGTEVRDPYRWLEDVKSPEVMSWMKSQSDYTSALLARIPGRKAMFERIVKYEEAVPSRVVQVARETGGQWFFERRNADENQFKLLMRDGLRGKDRLLVDPEAELSTPAILQVLPEPVVGKTPHVSMPEGGYVWNAAPLRSLQHEQLPETQEELPWPVPANAIPRLAFTAGEFDWEEADRAEQARIESEREPEEAGPVPLDAPPLLALSPVLVSQTATAAPWLSRQRYPVPWLVVATSTIAGR